MSRARFTLLGIGAAASPRYPPAGLLIETRTARVALDGGPGAEPKGPVDAWLVTDEKAELMSAVRRLARARDLSVTVDRIDESGLVVEPRPVVHTSHPAYGYRIQAGGRNVVWAPEFLTFPDWADGADLMFAEGSSWHRPIRFAHGAGGHAPLLEVADEARRRGVRRLVFAHVGRPTLRALDRGERPPYGEIGQVGRTYLA